MSRERDVSGACVAIADDLPLLALGTLDGRGRSAVLRHIDTCDPCRQELDELSLVADTLQQLTPEVQPPLGFELRLAERLEEVTTDRKRSRRGALLSAAAAIVVVLGLGALYVHGAGSAARGTFAAAPPVTADVLSEGRVVGSVMVSPGSPPWLLMTIQGGQWEGTVTCQVTLSSGRVVTVGTFSLSSAYPSWTAPLPTTGGSVVSARLIDAQGSVLASARLQA
jgi:hypothetical protein